MNRFTAIASALVMAFFSSPSARAQQAPVITPVGTEIVSCVAASIPKSCTTQGIGNLGTSPGPQATHKVFAGPAAGTTPASPTFRVLATADIPTGNSGANIPLLSGANTWSALQLFGGGVSASGQNIAYQNTYAPGVRAPLFIWQNPNGSTAAGYNAGLQIVIGNNPTTTPAAGDTVASTLVVTNGNNRGLLYGQNIVVGLCGTAEGCTTSDYINGPVTGHETDVYGSATWLPADRAFNPVSGTYVINGHEVYCQGPQYCTAGLSVWSTLANGANWWREGIALNRIANIGLHAVQTAGDTGTQFSVAFVQDDSNSANVIQIGSGTHTTYLNAPNAQITAAGNARFGNQGEGVGLTNYVVAGGSTGTSGFEGIVNGTVGFYLNTDGLSYSQLVTASSIPLLLGTNNATRLTISNTAASFSVPVTATGYVAGSSTGVSCAAGTVSLTTLVVTSGIVTHC